MPPLKGVTPHGVGRCPKGRGDRSVRGGPPLGGGEVLSCNLLCNVLECILFDICGDPSVSAAHCQLLPSGPFCHFVTFPHSMGNHPFQGSLIFLIFSSWKVPFATSHRDLAKILLFLSGFTRGAVLFAPRKKLPLFVPFSVRQKHGAESFAVCGRRLRGHVPSKNTSPTALSWISLFGHTDAVCFCPCTMIFVPAPVISQHVRSARKKLPLFVPFSVCPEAWARGFRRLRTAT